MLIIVQVFSRVPSALLNLSLLQVTPKIVKRKREEGEKVRKVRTSREGAYLASEIVTGFEN